MVTRWRCGRIPTRSGLRLSVQGKGFGKAIVLPGMQAAEQAGVPAFLETSDERNLQFYRWLGFEVTAEVAAPHGRLTLHRVRVYGHEAPTFGR